MFHKFIIVYPCANIVLTLVLLLVSVQSFFIGSVLCLGQDM